MPEPRTHYQVSFTSRQAVLLFVVVLASLAGAYFLGLMTGLAGRQPAETAAAAPALQATPGPKKTARVEAASGPAAVAAAATPAPDAIPAPTAVAAREPAAGGGLQFFEDRPEEPGRTTPAPGARQPSAAAAPPGAFFVQVLSTNSAKEANSRRAALSAHGYQARVSPAAPARGSRLYRVRIGPYASRDQASRAADALSRKEKVKTWIVPPGE